LAGTDFLFETEALFFDVDPADFELPAFVLFSSPIPVTLAPASTAPITAPLIAPVAAPLITSVKTSVAALTNFLTGLATFFWQAPLF
jgi:hypothetical protein